MKYMLKINDIILSERNTENIELNIRKDIENSLINTKNRIEINAKGNVFTDENKNIFKNLLILKDMYLEVEIYFEGISYKIRDMYIYNLTQNFSNGVSKFNLVLYQKFIGKENELILIEDSHK